MRSTVLVACFILLGATACSVGESSPTSAPLESTTVTDAAASESTPTTSLDASEEPAASASGPPVLDIGGAEPITLLTGSGGGDRPVFEWQPIDKATLYVVAVYDADGRPYWSGRTSETSLPLGSVPLPDEISGPRIDASFTWAVYALDNAAQIVATSELRQISP